MASSCPLHSNPSPAWSGPNSAPAALVTQPLTERCRVRTASAMAGSGSREDTYLYDLPYGVTRKIVQSLDADKSWEELASTLGYSFEQIKRLELEYARHNGSPTSTLLWEWGCSNATVRDLHSKLSQLNRIREMQILENYMNVDNEKERNARGAMNTGHMPSQAPPLGVIVTSSLPKPPSPPVKKAESIEVNFNQPSMPVKPPGNQSALEKHYDDKVIPGNPSEKKGPKAVEAEDRSMLRSSSRQPQESTATMSISSSSSRTGSLGPSSSSASSSVLSSTSSRNPTSANALASLVKGDVPTDVAVALLGTSSYSYRELSDATTNFHERNKLGEGAFGKVYYGVFRGNKCAIKKLQEDTKDEERDKRTGQLRCELTALLKYRHEHIVTLYGYALDGPSLCLVYQFMANGSLEDRLQLKDGTNPLSWDQRINIALGAARGLNFLHTMGEKPLIHGDIKSANILLDQHMEAKIGDLGQAQHANSGAATGKFTHITKKDMNSKIYGTRAYFPPELLRGGEAMSVRTDVFSFGVVILEICTGERAYEPSREPHKFLASYFEEKSEDLEEKEWPTLCDKKAGRVVDSILIKTLKVAVQCVKEKKKQRPETAQIVGQLEEIMDKLRSIEMPYHPPSLDSGNNYDRGNMAANIPPASHQSPLPSPTDIYRAKSLPEDIKASFLGGGHRSLGAESSGSAADLLPPGYQLPQSILLQQEYDRRKQAMSPESKEVDPLSSDPAKLAQLQRHDQQFEKGKAGKQSELPPTGSAGEESEPQSDPDKLRALRLFDAQNAMSKEEKEPGGKPGKEVSDSHFDCPPSDPKKLQHLMVFDAQNTGLQPSGPKVTEHIEPCEKDVKDDRADTSVSETDPKSGHTPISPGHAPISPGHAPISPGQPHTYSHTPTSYSPAPTSLGHMPTSYGHPPTSMDHTPTKPTSPDSGTGSQTPTPVDNGMESRQVGEAKGLPKAEGQDPMKEKMMNLFASYAKMTAGYEEGSEGQGGEGEADWPQEG